MSKPIEPGCRVRLIYVCPENEGQVVTVVSMAGPPGFDGTISYGPVWEVDRLVAFGWDDEPTSRAGYSFLVPEGCLERIDYDGNDVISWEDKRCVWRPEKIKEQVH